MWVYKPSIIFKKIVTSHFNYGIRLSTEQVLAHFPPLVLDWKSNVNCNDLLTKKSTYELCKGQCKKGKLDDPQSTDDSYSNVLPFFG